MKFVFDLGTIKTLECIVQCEAQQIEASEEVARLVEEIKVFSIIQ